MTGFAIAAILLTSSTSGTGSSWVTSCIPTNLRGLPDYDAGDADGPAVAQTLLLAAIFIGMGLVWLTSYALLVAKVGALLKRSVVRRALNAVTGTALTALGVRLAVTDR